MTDSDTDMKNIVLHNSTPFEPDSKTVPLYRVCSGTAYMFAVEKDSAGNNGFRFEVAMFRTDALIPALPVSGNLHFVLTGSLQTEIAPVPLSSIGADSDSRKKLYTALIAVSEKLKKNDTLQDAALEAAFYPEDRDAALVRYTEMIAAALVDERKRKVSEESERFAERIKVTDNVFSASLVQIASVLDGLDLTADIDSELSSVCRTAMIVGRYGGIMLQPIPGKLYNDANALTELAKDSNIRIRSVSLKQNWYKKDAGALFAYYAEDLEQEKVIAKPVALLPRKSGGYDCVDSENGNCIHINAQNELHILSRAFMFYRPLEDEPVSFKQLLNYSLHGLRRDSTFVVILGMLCAVVGLLIPELTRMFMDTIIPQAAKNMAIQISTLVLLCVISSGVFHFMQSLFLLRMEMQSDFSLQAAVMDRLLKLPVGFFKDYTSGELAQKTMAVSQIRSVVFGSIISSVMSFVFALVYLLQLFRYSSYLLRYAALFSFVPVLITTVIALLKYRWNKPLIELNGRISGMLFQFISGVNKLTMTASEKRAFSVWAKLFAKQNTCTSKAGNLDIVYNTFISFFPLFVTLAFYGIFMNAVAKGKMDLLSTGKFMAFMSSYSIFQESLISAASALMRSVHIVPLYDQAKTILHAEPEIQEAKPAVAKLSGAIEINHVSFRYSPDTPLILKDVSLKIEPGEFVAIVGGSGSGKSTLLRVLLGFETPEAGSVFFDNQELASLDVGSVRRNMGVVLQNSTIMQGSIFSNIVGSSALTIDDAWHAADMAGLSDDIREMPMGMHTMVSAGGGTLSGGQRQRLIIARAIARRPNILIFDEATSALDNRTQAQVSQSLESLKVTRIVIAHRLSTIINADRIYVLNNGIIEESGTYDELMKKDGFFAELAKRQQV